MRYTFLILLVVFAIASFSANAQIFEYRDADGNIRFTDDLGSVPEDRRDKIKRIQGVPRTLPSSEAPVKIDASIWDTGNEQENADQGEAGVDLFELGESLRSAQADLQKEYDSLEVEKVLLGDPPIHGAPDEDFDTYRARVEEINNRIQDYEERLQVHENRVKRYNARIGE